MAICERWADLKPEQSLPPGQFAAKAHPRFGLGRFRTRVFLPDTSPAIEICGDGLAPLLFDGHVAELKRTELTVDFHCVTTWSVKGITWGGWRFRDVYDTCVVPRLQGNPPPRFAILHGCDGYRSRLLLEDMLADDVLLADTINGRPLGLEHGAPVRIVAPAHYGYKSVKHLTRIELRASQAGYRFPFPYPGLMDHPRARVALEERASILPNWLVRPLYRLFLPREVR